MQTVVSRDVTAEVPRTPPYRDRQVHLQGITVLVLYLAPTLASTHALKLLLSPVRVTEVRVAVAVVAAAETLAAALAVVAVVARAG